MRQAMTQATRKAARASGGRPVRAQNLHVTLAFLGSVREERLAELAEIARQAAAARLGGEALAFDRLEYWRAAQLLCALPAEPPAWTAELARRLQDLLASRGFAPDLKPFRPHVTVVRKVARPGRIAGMQPVRWTFTEIALVESRTLAEGPVYSVIESFALCSGDSERSETEDSRVKAANNTRTR